MEIIVILIVLSFIVGRVASQKGRSFFGYFVLSLFASPLLPLLILIVLGDKKKNTINTIDKEIEKRKSSSKADNINKLIELSKLYEKGLLSKDEFEAQKAKLI
jgi:hypothetical protein